MHPLRTQDAVVVTLYGEPAAVIISYREYKEMEDLRKREQKRKALEALAALRQESRRQHPDLSAEGEYRLAGFSENVVEETRQADEKLAAPKP